MVTGKYHHHYLFDTTNEESILKRLFRQVYYEILPCFDNNFHLDFAGKILNSLNDWVQIGNDKYNDVVLTPRYVTRFMAQLAQVNMDSFVWDSAMGSGGFLVSAMDIMIKDAQDKIKDKNKLEEKIRHIKEKQLLGIEVLGNTYILAILNMILMGDGCSMLINGDGLLSAPFETVEGASTPNVFLLNPPYSAPGKGLIFVKEAFSQMKKGRAVILIQDSAGMGQGGEYAKSILKLAKLKASIKMPRDLFGGKANVRVYIFVFDVDDGNPHGEDDKVIFIDFSNDGYERKNRHRSSQEVNLRNIDNAIERYAEVISLVLNKEPKTSYYKNKCWGSTISLDGDDWNFEKHKQLDLSPSWSDLERTVEDYLAWMMGRLARRQETFNA